MIVKLHLSSTLVSCRVFSSLFGCDLIEALFFSLFSCSFLMIYGSLEFEYSSYVIVLKGVMHGANSIMLLVDREVTNEPLHFHCVHLRAQALSLNSQWHLQVSLIFFNKFEIV